MQNMSAEILTLSSLAFRLAAPIRGFGLLVKRTVFALLPNAVNRVICVFVVLCVETNRAGRLTEGRFDQENNRIFH